MSEYQDWDAIGEEFRTEGFLAAGADRFREHFRVVMAEWFDLAHRINAIGQRLYVECSDLLPGKKLTDPISLGLQMLPRCLSGFQGALILAERGLGVEAQALVRNIFETAFWIGYLSSDPEKAVPQLRWETLNSEIGLFEASLSHLKGMRPDTRSEVERQLVEMRREISALTKSPKAEEVANFAGYGASYFFYKDLSGAATHLYLKSIHVFLDHDEQGDVVGHQIGPDEISVGKAVWLGCRAMVLAIDALGRFPGCSAYREELSLLHEELERLEPYQGSI